MRNEVRFDAHDVHAVFRHCIATQDVMARVRDIWKIDETMDDKFLRINFAYLISHIVEWKSEVWSPPAALTSDHIERAYHAFRLTFTYDQLEEMIEAINEMRRGPASVVEKHDALLTEEEKEDPN